MPSWPNGVVTLAKGCCTDFNQTFMNSVHVWSQMFSLWESHGFTFATWGAYAQSTAFKECCFIHAELEEMDHTSK